MKKYWKRVVSMMLIAALLIQILPATAKGEEITILDEDLECEPQTGLADMYEYLTYDAGKAGTVHVNTYTGAPHVRRTDISLGGERMPVEITFYFDPENQFYKNPYGVGWSTSYNQWITYNSDTSQYQYKNENGTYIYFSNSGEATEDGYEIWTEVTTYGIGETGIELYRLAGAGLTNCTAVKLINIDKTYTFDGYGRLAKIGDGINEITITYMSNSTDAIKYVTDPAGRRYYFTYESGYLKTIDVRIEKSIVLPNTAVTYVMQSGVLTAVSYGTEDSVGYGYDSNGCLTSIKNIDGCGYEFHYAYNYVAQLDVVTGVIQKAAIGTDYEEAGTEVSIAYPADGITVITDDSTRNIYKFDGCGRVTSCELKYFVSATTYETVYGYNMTYDYVTNEDGTITNSLADVEYYDADGVIEEEEVEEESEKAESEEFTEEIESSEESGILEEGETAGEETETTEEVIEDYITTTDEYGNILTETHIAGELQQVKKYEYIYNGDMLSSITDVNGTTVKYTYGAPYSQITGITDGNGNKTSYTYNALGELTSAKMNVSGLKTLLSDRTITDSSEEIKAEYVYKQGRLTEIHYGGCVYAFTYDKWGNILRAAMNEKILVRYDYGDAAYKGLVQSAVYSTGQSVYYTYNSLGQVSTIGYAQGNVSFIYTYDSAGTLRKIFDKDYNITTEFTDDGYTIYKGTSENVLYFYNGTEEEYIENVLGKILSFEVENDGSVTIQSVMNEVTGANLYSEQTAYDAFERLDEKILSAGSLNITQSYDYVTTGNITGDRVSDYGITYNQGEDTNNLHFTYTYDGNGNITCIEKTEETADGAVTYKTEYTYDEAGQLKTAYDEELGIRYSYVYDAYGNIVVKQSSSVTADGESTRIESKVYEYDGMVLTKTYSTLEGKTEYGTNEMGNLTGVTQKGETYLYSWGMGRLLNQIVSESGKDRVLYDYNEEGLRIKKVLKVDGVSTITDYVWGKNGLAGYTSGTDTVVVLYGTDGTPIGFSLNDTVYTYLKNLQGDVIRILDTSGNTVVEYSYDPWGVPAITGDTELAAINPCSYRCYDYDEESGYYYLQSRYYNPETGRFLNADEPSLLEMKNTLQGHNLFVYCNNNPINNIDSSGYFSIKVYAIAAVTAAVISATSKIIGNYAKGYRGWNLFRGVLGTSIGNAINVVLLMKLIKWGNKGMIMAAFVASAAQTVIDFAEGVLIDKKYNWNQLTYDYVINFASTLMGNYLGSKCIYINGYWFQPKKAGSFFTKSYGKRLISQTGIGSVISLLIDLVRGGLEKSVKG